ncbi:MAG: phytanoyl-CoA dioxygenase family protein [Actinomycetota bacterium]|nr:phytanoyl-CoA dioxygenase family protein [Actinomycetota bacterium]
MFTHQQIQHFKSFGFVVLRGLLAADEVDALKAEVVNALTDAFGGIGADDDPNTTGGIRGDYLPLAVDRTPVSQALIADGPRFFHGSAQLLGQPTVPTLPIATCFTSNAGWHNDHGPDVAGVKFLAYLEARTADTGALRVLPGSHTPDFDRLLRAYWSQDPAASGFEGWPVPGVALDTAPGDVVAFDAHLFHSSAGGEKRLAWAIEYLPWPGLGDQERLHRVRDSINGIVDVAHKDYDRDRWPTWSEWAADPARSRPSRQTAIQRLRLLGVLGDER